MRHRNGSSRRGRALALFARMGLGLLGLGVVPAVLAAGAASLRSIEVSDARVAEGKTLFSVCSSCHGPGGDGRLGIAPRLSSETFLAAASDSMLVETIRDGRAGTTMIPWSQVFDEAKIEALVAYIRSLAPAPPADLDESPLRADAAAGEEIYTGICAACHGRAGGGYAESANGTGIGRSGFLAVASNGYLRHMIKHGKSDTQMRPFGSDNKVAVANLTDEQIDGVIAYLRQNAW